MKKLLFLLLIAFGAWQWVSQKPPGFTGQEHGQLIMYSLTTCGYCNQKRRELTAARIPFTEYFIDRDSSRRDELSRKLEKAGITPRAIGTPTFDVHGTMLINNPSMERIREVMARRKQT